MGYLAKIGLFIACLASTTSFAVGNQPAQKKSNSSATTVVTKLESSAFNSIKVKRLKKMLNQKNISSDQFFSQIESMVNGPKRR